MVIQNDIPLICTSKQWAAFQYHFLTAVLYPTVLFSSFYLVLTKSLYHSLSSLLWNTSMWQSPDYHAIHKVEADVHKLTYSKVFACIPTDQCNKVNSRANWRHTSVCNCTPQESNCTSLILPPHQAHYESGAHQHSFSQTPEPSCGRDAISHSSCSSTSSTSSKADDKWLLKLIGL